MKNKYLNSIRNHCRRYMCGALAGLILFAGSAGSSNMTDRLAGGDGLPWGAVRAQAAQTELADGDYQPDSFTFEGGTGRLSIECSRITVQEGRAEAYLHFSSSHISYVKVNDMQYDPAEQSDSGTEFFIPVVLNEKQKIIACTTAMSTPHEIEYVILCMLDVNAEPLDLAETMTEGDMETVSDEAEGLLVEEEAVTAMSQPLPDVIAVQGLENTGSISFEFAENVQIDTYEGGYRQIIIRGDETQYLIVPEGAEVPELPDSHITVLQQPLDVVYVAATASMALFNAIDALDAVRFSSLQAGGWYVEAAAAAMEAGDILYAGKYSQPDYEMLLSGACDLAVESTMILHAPEVKEMLEGLGIPVFVDRSSYESHPLGRSEWVKVYGVLTGHEEEAEAFFRTQTKILEGLSEAASSGKTVAFFSVNSGGSVTVRSGSDYIPKMIELAGGTYVPEDTDVLGAELKSTVTISMEEFYAAAAEADYLIYNSTIEAPISSVSDLVDKSILFNDFKAVQEGHVWCTDKYLYQATDIVGQLIMDMYSMMQEDAENTMTFLTHVE